MFRKLVKTGIQAVREGRDPDVLSREEKPVSTFCNDTVVHSHALDNPEEDTKMMRETGRRLAKDYIKNPPLSSKG
jgi:hypothetical protein